MEINEKQLKIKAVAGKRGARVDHASGCVTWFVGVGSSLHGKGRRPYSPGSEPRIVSG